ncbi:MAG TPA: T9SS type A sorting domain-containing protein [Candidatus Kapabacteria bacterium]
MNWSVWNAIHVDMVNAAFSSPSSKNKPDTLYKRVQQYISDGVIPIGILNMEYSWIDSNAIDDSLLYISGGQLHDNLSRTESPYRSRRTFASSFLAKASRSDTLSFVIDTSLFFLTNRQDTLVSFRIDFGDENGYSTFAFDSVYRTVMSGPGEATFMLQAIFLHDTLTSRALLQLAPQQQNDIRPVKFLDITSTQSYEGKKGQGTAWLVLGCGHTTIEKPLIFVEGFDPTNSLGPADYYYPNYFQDNGEDRPTTYSREFPHRQVFQTNTATNTTLGEELYKAGYDVIIVDFGPETPSSDNAISNLGGGDYIQRNAYVVEDLIEEINSTKVGDIENIVVGASMGGLIARYALADMEDRNIDHKSNLFVSFDSPQAGAYIPIGVLHILSWLNRQSGAKPQEFIDAVGAVSCPAAQQMLILNPFATSQVNNSDFFDDLIDIGGYPNDLRKVTIVNGSLNASSQGIGDGMKIFDWQPDFGKEWIVPALGIYCQKRGSFEAWELPVPSSSKFTIANIRTWCGIFDGPSYRVEYANFSGPIDNSPGSFSDHTKFLVDVLNKANPGVASTVSSDNHSYTPTISALDAFYPNTAGYWRFTQSNLYSTNFTNSPFDKIFGGNTNTFHVDMWNLIDNNGDYVFWKLLEDEAMMDDLFLQNRTIASGKAIDFEARKTISAGTNVTSYFDQGPFILSSGSTVNKMRAGSKITFRDGFRASGTLHAYIDAFDECEWPSTARSQNPPAAKQSGTLTTPQPVALSIYPNPTNEDINISYNVPEEGNIHIEIYDVLGSKISTILSEVQNAGEHSIRYSSRMLASGSYLIRLQYGSIVKTMKVVVSK